MGCGASSPAAAEAPAEEETLPGQNNDDNASTRQARSSGGHLHHSGEAASDEGGEAGNDDDDDDPEAKASYTRQRRLSHVRTAIDKESEGASDVGKGKLDGVVPVTDLLKKCAEEGPPAADLLIACATRAGDEPGYRKTNQDSYAVHEKFASTAGSFFAVFDGHGPNAKERVPAHLILTEGARASLKADPGESLKRAFSHVDGAGSSTDSPTVD